VLLYEALPEKLHRARSEGQVTCDTMSSHLPLVLILIAENEGMVN